MSKILEEFKKENGKVLLCFDEEREEDKWIVEDHDKELDTQIDAFKTKEEAIKYIIKIRK